MGALCPASPERSLNGRVTQGLACGWSSPCPSSPLPQLGTPDVQSPGAQVVEWAQGWLPVLPGAAGAACGAR